MDSSSFSSSWRAAAAARGNTQRKSRGRIVSGDEVEEELVSIAAAAAATGWGKGDIEPRHQAGVSLRGDGGGAPGVQEGHGEQGDGDRFLTYWSEKGTDRPVRVLFFNGADFQASGGLVRGDWGVRCG